MGRPRKTEPTPGELSTRDRVLEAGRELMMHRGYHAFSFHDVAAKVGVSHVAVHHYFKTKPDLAAAVVERYRDAFLSGLAAISVSEASAAGRLRAFVRNFATLMQTSRCVCLCGLLASESASLPEVVKGEVFRFYESTEAWLAGVVEEGRARGEVRDGPPAEEVAVSIHSALQGALTTAVATGKPERFEGAAQWLLGGLLV